MEFLLCKSLYEKRKFLYFSLAFFYTYFLFSSLVFFSLIFCLFFVCCYKTSLQTHWSRRQKPTHRTDFHSLSWFIFCWFLSLTVNYKRWIFAHETECKCKGKHSKRMRLQESGWVLSLFNDKVCLLAVIV